MADQNPKQQIVDKLRDVETVMITVNSSPSVDELSAALGFTLLLNKLNKHATAIFSGSIPPAITFLDPEKTFENTVDSLRDFIIALDKEKADHLRYKVDGDVVKIFITPYRTTISQDDLDFTQGDYNVEMVVALGVRDEQDLDRALREHGKIMHDATVASVSIGSDGSELGSMNWHESEASSYSELLVSLAEALRNEKNLIDEQIATAFLTGIVAATDRFSNNQTTSKVMTMAAQLMAAGANQQLIATKLEEAAEIPARQSEPGDKAPEEVNPDTSNEQPDEQDAPVTDKQQPDGSMQISHEKEGDVDQVATQVEQENQAAATKQAADALNGSKRGNDEALADVLSASAQPHSKPTIEDLRHDLENAKHDEPEFKPPTAIDQSGRNEMTLPAPSDQTEPTMGGTLNATADQASQERRRQEEADRSRQVLNHGSAGTPYVAAAPSNYPTINSFDSSTTPDGNSDSGMPGFEPLEQENHTHGATIEPPKHEESPAPAEEPLPPMPTTPSFADMGHDDARAAIESALQAGPTTDDQQAALAAAQPNPPELPPLTSEPAQFPQPSQSPMPPVGQPLAEPAPQGGELPPLPPMPDFSTLPPMPGAETGVQGTEQPMPPAEPQQVISADPSVELPPLPSAPDMPPATVQTAPPAAQSNDPGQFQIPSSQP